MWNKRLFGRGALVAGLLMAALATSYSPVQAASLDKVREKGTLTVGVYRDFAPFSSMEKGQVVGVDVDLGRELAKRMSLTPSFIEIPADESVDDDLRNGVWRGPVTGGPVADVMMHVPYDQNLRTRNDMVVLFGPYYQENLAVARAKPTLSAIELSDERVGVEISSLADLYLSGSFGGSMRDSTHRYLSYALAAKAMEEGEISALMGPRSQLEDAIQRLPAAQAKKMVVSIPGTPGLSMRSWPLGMAVKVDGHDLAYALGDVMTAMLEDGTVAKIFKKHGLTYQKSND